MRVAGYKWLFVGSPWQRAAGAVLVSSFDAHEWTLGPNVASYAPSAENLWGFNAYYSPLRARLAAPRDAVVVGVVGFGTVALFSRGWRSEKAEIVAAYLPRRLRRRWDDELQPLMTSLRTAYDIPVYLSLRPLRRETERWGVPGRALLHGERPSV